MKPPKIKTFIMKPLKIELTKSNKINKHCGNRHGRQHSLKQKFTNQTLTKSKSGLYDNFDIKICHINIRILCKD